MKRIFFFVGPNGCGKTRRLTQLAKNPSSRTLAIANTPFPRFKKSTKNALVFRISPRGIKKIIADNLKKFFDDKQRDTFDISELLETIGFDNDIQLQIITNDFNPNNLFEILRSITSDSFEIDSLASGLEFLRSSKTTELSLSHSYDSFERSLRGRNRILFKYIIELKEKNLIFKYNILFKHITRGYQTFDELSSGEQTLISTYLFIKSNVKHYQAIYIDEPENSLHPEWQRNYLKMLHIAIGYNDIKIYLATHSPLLVSGALTNYGNEVDVMKINNDEIEFLQFTGGPESVEEILWKAFNALTPVNHYLSIQLSQILQQFAENKMNQEEVIRRLKNFQDKSYDKSQINLFNRIINNLDSFSNA